MSREAFLFLIKQEFKWIRDRKRRNWWSLLYVLLGIACGLTFFTFSIRKGSFQFQYMWLFTYAFPFVMLGLSFGSISKEWKNRMYGWWLSLPYSREKLVQTKFIAAWLQTATVFLFSFGVMVIFSVYAVMISDTFTFELMLEHLGKGLPWLLTLFVFYPVVAGLSFLTFISGQTKYRPISPLLWLILIVSINGFFWTVRPFDVSNSEGVISSMFTVEFTSVTWFALIASWVLAWGLLRLAARWLERELII